MKLTPADVSHRLLPILLSQAVGLGCGIFGVKLTSAWVSPTDLGALGVFMTLAAIGASVFFAAEVKFISRYWAARELTKIEKAGNALKFRAPFACPDFTIQLDQRLEKPPTLAGKPLQEVNDILKLNSGTWFRDDKKTVICFALAKGASEMSCA